jgi:hypothetical protein
MISRMVSRDEREAGIDLAADRLSYLILSYGLLVLVAYRAFALGQASWDLLGLVILGGLVGTGYRFRGRAAARGWAAVVVGTVVVAAVVAAVLVLTLGGR